MQLCPENFRHKDSSGIGTMRRNKTHLRRMLEKAVGRSAVDHRQEAEMEHGGEIEKIARLEPRAVPFGEQQCDDLGVLFADLSRKFGQDACGHSKVNPDIEDMTHPNAAAGDYEHFKLL